jgi:hypothetical protein
MTSLHTFRTVTRVTAIAAVAVCGLACRAPAHANAVFATGTMPVDPAAAGASSLSTLGQSQLSVTTNAITSTLYDGTTLYSGVNFTQFEINVPAAGNLMVSLMDLAFPVAAGALSFSVVEGGKVLGVLPNAGSLEVAVSGAGRLFAFAYAVGAPGTDIGSYYLNIRHEYEEPVPLPASLWLLLSGAAWAGWLGRRKVATKAA